MIGFMNVPPELTPKALAELKAIYKDEYNEEVSDEEAADIGRRLLTLFAILYLPSVPAHFIDDRLDRS